MAGLQFSDVSGRQGLIQDCEDLLNFPATGISNNTALLQQFTRSINSWYQKIITMIFASQDSWQWDEAAQTNYPTITTTLFANQQDYVLPSALNFLRIERLDISFDNGNSWRRATATDSPIIFSPLDTIDIANNFSIDKPFYDIKSNAIFIYPIPTANSVNGLTVQFARGPLEFSSSDTTKVPGIDQGFHRMLSIGAAYDYAFIKNLPTQVQLKALLDDYEQRLKQYYGLKEEDFLLQMKAIYDDKYFS